MGGGCAVSFSGSHFAPQRVLILPPRPLRVGKHIGPSPRPPREAGSGAGQAAAAVSAGSLEPGADLISWGQLFTVHIWQRAAAVPPPPARPALPSRNAGSSSCIWSVFLGAAGAPSGACPRLGGRPTRISWLLPPLAAGGASQAGLRLDHETERVAGLGFLPVALGGPQGSTGWSPL